MDTFWLTPATIKAMYGNDFLSVPFFGTVHIIELALVLITCIIVGIIYKKSNEKNKHKILVVINVLIWIDEIVKYAATIPTGQWIWNYLPLHLCSINIFTCTLHTITKSDKLKDFLYALCLPGAILALISSPWFAAPVLNIMHLHSYTIHALLILYTILTLVDGYKPSIKRIPFNGLYLSMICIPVFFINKLLNTNFLYINKYDEVFITKILYGFLGNYYVFAFPILLMIVWFALYIPWNIKRKQA